MDLSAVDGFGVSLAQTVTMEVGSNVGEKFSTEKHFCSWLGLAPKHDNSGGKVLKNRTLKTKNRAGQAFCTLAPHRVPWHRPPGQVWCSAGEYKVEYDPLSVNEYQKQYEVQQVKYMKKKAAKFGYQLIPA
jgi:hypothetical protein